MEIVHDKAELVTALLFFCEGCVNLISPALLLILTRDTEIFIYIALILLVISMVLLSKMFIPESFKHNLAMKKFDQVSKDVD